MNKKELHYLNKFHSGVLIWQREVVEILSLEGLRRRNGQEVGGNLQLILIQLKILLRGNSK